MSTDADKTRVVIPVKAFRRAKGRLASALDDARRSTLARMMAERVVAAAAGYPAAVACDDDEVEAWAAGLGVDVIRTDGADLNGTAAIALREALAGGWRHLAIIHADLPFVRSLRTVFGRIDTPEPTLTIVPDRHRTGTNALVVPTTVPFAFSFGPGSFTRHLGTAEALGLVIRVIEDDGLSWDIDEPQDLVVNHGDVPAGVDPRPFVDAGLLRVDDAEDDHALGHEMLPETTPQGGSL